MFITEISTLFSLMILTLLPMKLLFHYVSVIAGAVCSVISGATWLSASITDMSLLAHSSWRQSAVAWEVSRGRFNWASRVGWTCHTPTASEPHQLLSVECIHENVVEECLQATKDDWKQLESVSTAATKGELTVTNALCWLHSSVKYIWSASCLEVSM